LVETAKNLVSILIINRFLAFVIAKIFETNKTLVPEVTQLVEAHDRLVLANTRLSAEVESLELRKMRSAVDTDLAQYKAEIERYCLDVPDLIVWGRYCTHIGFPD
jgi:cell division protein FtsB